MYNVYANYNHRVLALRYVYVLALMAWLGGMLVLGALVAPTVFEVLPRDAPSMGRELAGALFGAMLARFHYVAYAAGGLLLVTLTAMALLGPRPAGFAARALIIVCMLGVAVYSGVVVLGRIDRLQQEIGGLPSRLPEHDGRRQRFDRLHRLSTQLMLLNVAGALLLVYWEARDH